MVDKGVHEVLMSLLSYFVNNFISLLFLPANSTLVESVLIGVSVALFGAIVIILFARKFLENLSVSVMRITLYKRSYLLISILFLLNIAFTVVYGFTLFNFQYYRLDLVIVMFYLLIFSVVLLLLYLRLKKEYSGQ